MQALGVSSMGARAMLAAFEALGLDGDELCRCGGFERAVLSDPDHYVAPPSIFNMWLAAMQRWGRPDLGLRAGASLPFGSLEVLDYLVATSPTLGDGVRQLCAYLAIATTMIQYEIDSGTGAHVRVRLRPFVDSAAIPPPLRDFNISTFTSHLVAASGGLRPACIEITGTGLAGERVYREVLGCDIRFRQEANVFVIALRDWDTALPRRDPILGSLLRRHADSLVERVPRAGIVDEVRKHMLRSLPDGEPTLASLARGLGIGTRTLQRRLAEAGVSVSDLLDETRRLLAHRYLDEPTLSISEAGLLLGYSEPSAFHRAFKRWTGTSPSEYRARRSASR